MLITFVQALWIHPSVIESPNASTRSFLFARSSPSSGLAACRMRLVAPADASAGMGLWCCRMGSRDALLMLTAAMAASSNKPQLAVMRAMMLPERFQRSLLEYKYESCKQRPLMQKNVGFAPEHTRQCETAAA
jgi:hypothetical protein